MKISDLFPDANLAIGFTAFDHSLSKKDEKMVAALIKEFANTDGGNLFVGVDDFGNAFGLSVDDIIGSKSFITSINQTLLSPAPKLCFVVKNVDSMSENCVLYVQVIPSGEKIRLSAAKDETPDFADQDFNSYVPSPAEDIFLDIGFDLSSFSSFSLLCQKLRPDRAVPSGKELFKAGLVDKFGSPCPELSLWSDSPSPACPKINAFLYRGVEKSEFVLDSFENRSSLSEAFASLLGFVERNTRVGKAVDASGNKVDRKSYPELSFVKAFAAGLSHLDYSSSNGEISIGLFSNRIEIECSGSLLDSCLDVSKNRLIHACFNVMGINGSFDTCFQDVFSSYSGFSKTFEPKVLCGKNSFTIVLYDTLYEPTVFEERIVNNELSPEQEKVLDSLSSGPKTTLELMAKSPYKSRAAFGKFVINPLINGDKIARIGKTNSPKAKLIRLG